MLQVGRLVGATPNSEGFRDSFLRNGRKTQGAKMAGKIDAKQKAGPCDRTERAKKRNPGEPEKELRRDPKEQGEPKKSSLTKRRQARKLATMVKQLKKNPEDLDRGGGWADVRGRMGRAAASLRSSLCSLEGNAAPGGVASPCQFDGEDLAQRERGEPGWSDPVAQCEQVRGDRKQA
jgi:hypothetical protein